VTPTPRSKRRKGETRRIKRKQRKVEWRENKRRRRGNCGQERRQLERRVVTGVVWRKSAILVKSHPDNDRLRAKMFGLGKWGRLKATGAETGSGELIG
jgi:hypothetical protein